MKNVAVTRPSWLEPPPQVVSIDAKLEQRAQPRAPSWMPTATQKEATPPEPKAEPKPAPKAEPKPAPKAEPTVEPKSEAKPAPEFEAKELVSLTTLLQQLSQAEQAATSSPDVVALAMLVVRSVLEREPLVDPALLERAVEHGIKALRGDAPTRVRVHPLLLEHLQRQRPDLETSGVELLGDAKLGLGGCVVESRHRAFNASLEQRLERFAAALSEALMTEGR